MRTAPIWAAWALACGPSAYPTVDVDWTPGTTEVCGLDPAPLAVLPGEWPDARPGLALAVMDLDGDGFDEVAYSVKAEEDFSTGALRIHRGGPSGPEPSPWVEAWGAPGEQLASALVALGDVDGDGRRDLAVASTVFVKDAEAEVTVTHVWSAAGSAAPAPAAFEAPGGATLASVDANGDGLGDLVVGADGMAALYLGAMGGLGPEAAVLTNDAHRFAGDHAVGLGDADGDGHGELLVADSAGRLYLAPGAGLDGDEAEVADVGDLESLASGDLDGDGLADWIAGWRNDLDGEIGWWPGAAPAADPAVTFTGSSGSQRWFARALPDLDGDGDDELVIGARAAVVDGAEYAGQVTIHPGGAGGPEAAASFTIAAHGARCFFGEQLELGDVDGDGAADLVGRVSGDNETATDGDAIVVVKGEAAWVP